MTPQPIGVVIITNYVHMSFKTVIVMTICAPTTRNKFGVFYDCNKLDNNPQFP